MSRIALLVLSGLLAVAVPAAPARAEPAPQGRLVLMVGTGENGYSGDGQRATDARISTGGGLAVGADGTLYLADSWSGRVRAVRDGVIDTVPGTRALRSPETDGPEVDGWQYSPSDRPAAVAVGPDGALYVLGDSVVRRIAADGTITKVADTPVSEPSGIAVDAAGQVYVSGAQQVVRLDAAGAATTIAGGGQLDPVAADGKPATEAGLPRTGPAMALDAKGAVYLVLPRSPGREQASLHRIDPDGTLHTVMGAGKPGFAGDGGPVARARVSEELGGVTAGQHGEIYVHDAGNHVVREIDAHGRVTTLLPPLPADAGTLPGGGAVAVGPHGEIFVKVGARVFRLTRDGEKPAPPAARTPSYPARFADDEPGTVHTVAGNGVDISDGWPPRLGTEKVTTRLAVAPDGTRYYSDSPRDRVMKVGADGKPTVFAGVGEPDFSGDGGPATRAALNGPSGLAVGPDGSVFIADVGNARVRKVDPNGVITTVAGDGSRGESGGSFGEYVTVRGDGGPATAATVTPTDVAVAGDGTLFIAEEEDKRVSRVAPDGTISTFAGGGKRWMDDADGHPAREAAIFRPFAVTLGPDGTVYVLDRAVDLVWPWVRMIGRDGIMRTVAGDSYRDEREAGFGGDGGPAAKAELNNPRDITAGPDGTLYIADTYNSRVRAVDPAGTIRTVAGTGERAVLNEPEALAVGPDGTLYVIESPRDRIRAVAGGQITTSAELSGEQRATPATRTPVDGEGLAVDADGGLLIAGGERGELSEVDARGTLARTLPDLPAPGAVAVGPDGARYVASGDLLYRVTGRSAPVLVAGGGPGADGDREARTGEPALLANFAAIVDVAVSPAGRVYVASDNGVYRIEADGTVTVAYHGDKVDGIAVDGDERLYVADSTASRVYGVSDGKPEPVAGNGQSSAEEEENVAATEASVYGATDVATDGEGNLYVATYDGIRRVDPDGTIRTVAGNTAIGAMTVDRDGNLYYFDSHTNQVKVVVRPGDLPGPFPWATVLLLTAGVLAVAAAAWYYTHRRRLGAPQPTPEADEPAAE